MHAQDRTPVGKHSPFTLLPEYGGKILFTIEDSDGIRYEAWHRTHDFKGFRQRYDRISDYLNGSEVRYGKIMEADCCVMDAEALWSRGSAVLREDPYAFVERIK